MSFLLIHRMHLKKIMKANLVFGTGNPLREFLHVDDLSKAILFVNENNIERIIKCR